jgi:hypothetical protein
VATIESPEIPCQTIAIMARIRTLTGMDIFLAKERLFNQVDMVDLLGRAAFLIHMGTVPFNRE